MSTSNLTNNGSDAFSRWAHNQITAVNVKPTDLLWEDLNSKGSEPLDGMGAIHFINLVRKCCNQDPLHKDPNDPSQSHNSAKKNAYKKEWRARKKAQAQETS